MARLAKSIEEGSKVVLALAIATLIALYRPVHAQSVTPAQRMASLNALKTHVGTLQGRSAVADAQSVLAFIRNRPETWKGATVIDGSVSAQWADGATVIVNVVPSVQRPPGSEPTPTPTPPSQRYTLSGSVLQGTAPTPRIGIEVARGGQPVAAASTGTDGRWSVPNLVPGLYTVTPRAEGFTFTPASRQATISNGAVTVPPFAATPVGTTPTPTPPPVGRYTISGTVTVPAGHSKEGFTILALRNNNPDDFLPPVSTNVDGAWTMSNVPAGTYAVSAFKVFYDVQPEAHTVTVSGSMVVPPFTAVHNPLPGTRTTARAIALAAAPDPQLPASRQARVLDTTPHATGASSTQLRNVLRQPRFNYHMASPDASLEALKRVAGDGLFYMNAYFGLAKIGGVETCFVQTSTPVRLDNVGQPAAVRDMRAGSLTAMMGIDVTFDAVGKPVRKQIFTNYGIGPRFIRDYKWRFSRHSLVWINTGHSQNAPLRQAILDAGASVYGGWNKGVPHSAAVNAAQWLLDRLLGANELQGMTRAVRPEPIPQRAFPLNELLPEMARKGLDVSARPDSAPARLTFTRNQRAGHFGLLAPSIQQMYPDEIKGQLTLLGTFGSAPADGGRVTIAGRATPVVKWEPDSITCVLPPASQPFGSGDVAALADGRSSNEVKLSKWEGVFIYEHDDAQNLKRTITIRAVMRGDAHLFRTKPGEAPGRSGPIYIGPTSDSSTRGSFKAEGSASETQTYGECTVTVGERWSGSGSLSANNILLYNGEVKVAARQITFGLGVRPLTMFFLNKTSAGCSVSDSQDFKAPLSIDPSVAGNARGMLTFQCNARWSAPAGSTGWKTKASEVFLLDLNQYQVRHQISWPDGLVCTNPPPDTPSKEEGA
jgi:hypothetical protein